MLQGYRVKVDIEIDRIRCREIRETEKERQTNRQIARQTDK